MQSASVALRKESVDRNILSKSAIVDLLTVALRKESVDRNFPRPADDRDIQGRSPQGERG